MSEETRSRKVQEWSERLLRFSKSGQTVLEFCRSEGVSQPSFYVWRKQLKAIGSAAIAEHDPSAKAVKPVSPLSFEPVSLDPHHICGAGLKVRLPGGIELELGGDPNVIEPVARQLIESALQLNGPQPC